MGPPLAQGIRWCTSQTEGGWVQPGNWQCWSRWMTAVRRCGGMVRVVRPRSSGWLGVLNGAPSRVPRRWEASPPGPDSRSRLQRRMVACRRRRVASRQPAIPQSWPPVAAAGARAVAGAGERDGAGERAGGRGPGRGRSRGVAGPAPGAWPSSVAGRRGPRPSRSVRACPAPGGLAVIQGPAVGCGRRRHWRGCRRGPGRRRRRARRRDWRGRRRRGGRGRRRGRGRGR